MSTLYTRRRAEVENRRRQRPWTSLFVKIAMLAAALIILSLRTRPAPEEPPKPRPGTVPPWVVEDLLPVNPYSRPGTPLDGVNGVVVHYTGNPGTTAAQNRNYFAGLADTHETYASSQFIVDLDGTVLQCVPLDEVAYCSSRRNADTLSIEVCHPDETGAFTEESREALVALVQWLCDAYGLGRDQVIRHYDVTGKDCPLYYVDHPDEWEQFLDDLGFVP